MRCCAHPATLPNAGRSRRGPAVLPAAVRGTIDEFASSRGCGPPLRRRGGSRSGRVCSLHPRPRGLWASTTGRSSSMSDGAPVAGAVESPESCANAVAGGGARHPSRLLLGRDPHAQALPTLGPSPLEHGTPRARAHAGAKTMAPPTPHPTRLVGPLHRWDSSRGGDRSRPPLPRVTPGVQPCERTRVARRVKQRTAPPTERLRPTNARDTIPRRGGSRSVPTMMDPCSDNTRNPWGTLR